MASYEIKVKGIKEEIVEKETVHSDRKDMQGVIVNLKTMQGKINDILTKFVEMEQGTDDQGQDSAEEESDDEDDSTVLTPKKCKLK